MLEAHPEQTKAQRKQWAAEWETFEIGVENVWTPPEVAVKTVATDPEAVALILARIVKCHRESG